MSPRHSLARLVAVGLLAVAGCGSGEEHHSTTPAEDVATCPSEAAPDRCGELAAAAANAGHGELAWAYTALACESPSGAQCAGLWQRYAKLAPTQTDALNVLHVACDHVPAACELLAAWHTDRGHRLAAAAYQKRAGAAPPGGIGPSALGSAGQPAQPGASSTLALASDLAAIAHVSDGPPRTAAIDQMIGRELRAPVTHAAKTSRRKAWPMHAAPRGASSDACAGTAERDHHQVALGECILEVGPFDGDQIALLNRCNQPLNVTYTGARADTSTFTQQVRLEAHEARGAGISHAEIGPLTYAVCVGTCRVTNSSDDVTAGWTGRDATYYCVK